MVSETIRSGERFQPFCSKHGKQREAAIHAVYCRQRSTSGLLQSNGKAVELASYGSSGLQFVSDFSRVSSHWAAGIVICGEAAAGLLAASGPASMFGSSFRYRLMTEAPSLL